MDLPKGYPYIIWGALILISAVIGVFDPTYFTLSLAFISVGLMMSRDAPSLPAAILACMLVFAPYLSDVFPYLTNAVLVVVAFIFYLILEFIVPEPYSFHYLLVRYLLFVPLILWTLTSFWWIVEAIMLRDWATFLLHTLFLLLVFTDTMTLLEFWEASARIRYFRLLLTATLLIMTSASLYFYATPLSII